MKVLLVNILLTLLYVLGGITLQGAGVTAYPAYSFYGFCMCLFVVAVNVLINKDNKQ
jgi:hypothetical protein